MRHLCAFAAIGILGLTGTATALNQDRHASVTMIPCINFGFTVEFCTRVADEAYNTDYHEFADNTAHAIPYPNERQCETLTNVVRRAVALGKTARGALRTLKGAPFDPTATADLAKALGRALHTIEDNCAHEGMPNAQHAWHSLQDACEGTEGSPDIQPAATECAEREARSVFASLDLAVAEFGIDRALLRPPSVSRHYPPRRQVCEFLGEWSMWDGVDRRWNNVLAAGTLYDHYNQALRLDLPVVRDACELGIDLSRTDTYAKVDTSGGLELCSKVDVYCAGTGKADEAGAEEPPWSHSETEDQTITAGCTTTTGNATPVLFVLALAVLGGTRRSRQRSPGGVTRPATYR